MIAPYGVVEQLTSTSGRLRWHMFCDFHQGGDRMVASFSPLSDLRPLVKPGDEVILSDYDISVEGRVVRLLPGWQDNWRLCEVEVDHSTWRDIEA